jgi:energy-converting hydrogenase Eha subunit C
MSGFTKSQIESFYFIGILAGLAVTLFLQTRLSVNICLMLNLSFAFLAIGFLIDIIQIQYPDVGLASAVCFGNAYAIGIVNVYYLAGLMIKKIRMIDCVLLNTGFIYINIFGSSTTRIIE